MSFRNSGLNSASPPRWLANLARRLFSTLARKIGRPEGKRKEGFVPKRYGVVCEITRPGGRFGLSTLFSRSLPSGPPSQRKAGQIEALLDSLPGGLVRFWGM